MAKPGQVKYYLAVGFDEEASAVLMSRLAVEKFNKSKRTANDEYSVVSWVDSSLVKLVSLVVITNVIKLNPI